MWFRNSIPGQFKKLMRNIKTASLSDLLEAERQFADWDSKSQPEREIALMLHRYIWIQVRQK